MSSNKPLTQGKGSRNRTSDFNKYRDNWPSGMGPTKKKPYELGLRCEYHNFDKNGVCRHCGLNLAGKALAKHRRWQEGYRNNRIEVEAFQKFIAPKIKSVKVEPDTAKRVFDEFRVCEFCGCRTNARIRRCCDKGYDTDITESINYFKKKRLT